MVVITYGYTIVLWRTPTNNDSTSSVTGGGSEAGRRASNSDGRLCLGLEESSHGQTFEVGEFIDFCHINVQIRFKKRFGYHILTDH